LSIEITEMIHLAMVADPRYADLKKGEQIQKIPAA
jgi:hypothetical protein